MSKYKILIYGYGNPGRQDDGLGNAFVELLEDWVNDRKLEGFEFDSNYQLNIEDAAAVADKDLVIFADASIEKIESFILTPVDASTKVAFTTHAASPGYIIGLCKKIYNRIPPTYLVHIKGYEWEFKEGLTKKAKQNLEESLKAMKEKLLNPSELIDSFKEFDITIE
ncbi:MAG: hydrogenase maturation protease [Bacteroidales bacterium]|nr:hydrogenase maturation protease [Bacteroidales bacterium]